MKVLFRAEGSERIGAGHIMRCIALAQALLDRGHEVFFVCFETSPHFIQVIREMVNEPLCFTGAAGSTQDSTQCKVFVESQKIDWVVIDTYSANAPYMTALKQTRAKVAVIDDIADREIDADIIINQSLGANTLEYKLLSPAKMLTGLSYMMLRREYAHLPTKPIDSSGSIKKVLVSLGGSPPFDYLRKLLHGVFDSCDQSTEIRAVLGSLSTEHRQILESDFGKMSRGQSVVFLSWLESLHDELLTVDLFVTASGSTVFEALTLSVPMALCYFADNQRVIYSALVSDGICDGVGDLRELDENKIAGALRAIFGSVLGQKRPAIAGLDGRGALRIVDELDNYLK